MQVFVVDLDGRSLVRRVLGDLSVHGLRDLLVSVYPDVDSNWYLMFNGKLLSGGLLTELGVCDTATITKKGRLRGGVNNSVPGSFFCPTCNQGGQLGKAALGADSLGWRKTVCPLLPLVRREGEGGSFARNCTWVGSSRRTMEAAPRHAFLGWIPMRLPVVVLLPRHPCLQVRSLCLP